jgi:hypothetical protein
MQIMGLLMIHYTRSSFTPGAGLDVSPHQFIPAALLGTWLGLAIFRRLSDRLFTLAVNLLLLVSGVAFLV